MSALVLGALLLFGLTRVRHRLLHLVALSGMLLTAVLPNLGCGDGRNPRAGSHEITAWPSGAILYVDDRAGSPLARVDESGRAESWATYSPYGEFRSGGLNSDDPWGFGGHEVNNDTDLVEFGGRPYRADLGRFLAVDPAALESTPALAVHPDRYQAYSYGAGNPVDHIDRDGHIFWFIALGAALEAIADAALVTAVVGTAAVALETTYERLQRSQQAHAFDMGVPAGSQAGTQAGSAVRPRSDTRPAPVSDPSPEPERPGRPGPTRDPRSPSID